MSRPFARIRSDEGLLTRLAVPALLGGNVALACGPWLVRLAQSASHIGPVAAAFWRVTLALPILLLIGARAGESRPAAWLGPFLIAMASGLFFAADLGAWHVGILHTRLANATLFGNVTAILFPIYGFLVARHWPSRRQALAIALASLGAILLLGRSYELSTRNIVGDLLCILAGLLYTGYLIAIDRVRSRIGPITIMILSAAAGAPFLLLASLGLGEHVWPDDWTPLVLLTFGSQIIGQGMILFAVNRVPPIVVGLMLLTQPIVGSAIGWIVYGERLTVFDLIGGVAIGLAVLLVRDARRPLPEERNGLSSAA
ncbi:DMT family transporter [Sphingomonas sp. MMS24-J13]|uniref:DMT family transporter n=1 Tax=Sphingomonas sp. MMS24-J13 TaxID=3238686 RepID=UPI00384D3076